MGRNYLNYGYNDIPIASRNLALFYCLFFGDIYLFDTSIGYISWGKAYN